MIFANTNKELTVIYHSDDHLGRQILAYAETESLPIHDIDLKYITLTPLHWAELASRLKMEVKDLINVDDPDFMEKFSDLGNLNDNDWLTLLVHNPDILRAPIVMKGVKIVMMTNSQDMLYFVEKD